MRKDDNHITMVKQPIIITTSNTNHTNIIKILTKKKEKQCKEQLTE